MKNLSVYASLPLLIIALTVTGNVNAAETDDSKAEKTSDSKATKKGGSKSTWYIGGSYGVTKYEDLCDSVSGEAGATCDNEADGYKIIGGTRISPNLAFEAAYVDMGDATAATNTTKLNLSVTGINFSVLGIKPLSKSFDIFGKLGLMLWEAKTTKTTGPASHSVEFNDSDINLGFGANYNINETFTLRAEFERFHNISYESSLETPVSLLSLGVVVSF